ncbi:hypothetical protein BYT27DRAFT_7240236 [Phlegmacium glaucopus]|nr:hypothetical protein BYT27DRAFT_7244146 [Phlegmacium glaucopus]KAF8811649.1 hypothetical protein BYT27DRAFT_7240236 [Phlegmacium glaucopus]
MRIYAESCAEKAKSEQPLLTSSLPSLSSTNVLNKHQHSWIMPTLDAGQLRDHAASSSHTQICHQWQQLQSQFTIGVKLVFLRVRRIAMAKDKDEGRGNANRDKIYTDYRSLKQPEAEISATTKY